MEIPMFAIIGASIKAPTAYWICFAFYCLFKMIKVVVQTIKEG